MFDLVIQGSEVFDGTGAPGFPADIGIVADRIAAIGRITDPGRARLIDARGLAAAPGFVDIHSHSDYHLLLNPRSDSSVRQGVTSEIGGNCGYAAAPIWGPWLADRAQSYKEVYGLPLDWTEVREYFERLAQVGISVNYGQLIGHNTLRGSAMGGADRPPTADELGAMVEGVRRGMADGALGLSTGLVYSPACFARADEVVALCAVAGEAGGIFATHMRSEGDGLLEAIAEVIEVAERARIPLQISHLKTSGPRNWDKLGRAIALIEAAQARGLDVACDRYPYTAANTGLQAMLPRWGIEGDTAAQRARLKDPAARRRLTEAVLAQHPEPDYFDRVMISDVTQERNRRYTGLRVSQAATVAGQPPMEFVLDLLWDESNRVEAIYFTMSEENLRAILRKPYVMIGSDSGCRAHYGPLSQGTPHPRTFGTFARALGHYARDERLFDLPTAIRKMTWDPCRRLGLAARGRLRQGAVADLVLFDPGRIIDRATYEAPIAYPDGVAWVLVNGQVVVESGEHTGARPGRPLRRGAA
jgi:N-acyl-D-amino-acid deacylase